MDKGILEFLYQKLLPFSIDDSEGNQQAEVPIRSDYIYYLEFLFVSR